MPDLTLSNSEGGGPAPAGRDQFDDANLHRQLDRLARLSARICEAPIAMVTLVFADTQLFVGKSGVKLDAAPLAHSFCVQAMAHDGLMTVSDARLDLRFSANPMVTGAPHIRFYAGQPLVSADGTPQGSFCVIDSQPRAALSPDQVEALETLAEAATALLEKWRQATEHRRQSVTSKARLDHMEQRFEVLVNALPQLVWSSLPDGMTDYFSEQWCKFIGQPAAASTGARWMEFLHPDDVAGTSAAWTEAMTTDSGYAVNYRLRRHDGEYVWMLARGLPIRDSRGEIVRWIGTCTDIQGQMQASEMLQMMSQELSHRIKNLFAVTQGLISMTLRNHPALKPVAGEMQSRLRALGRAHDLVRPQFVSHAIGHADPSLRELLDTLMTPYASDQQPRWQIEGGDIPVGEQAATPLALFIHEMGTNSLKYGALSADNGYIAITVECDPQIVIHWREHGGPTVVEPAKRGFGYRLAELSIVRQLGGTLQFDWLPDGLEIKAEIPASAVSSASRPNSAASAVPHYAD